MIPARRGQRDAMRAGGAGQARGASEGELKGGMVGDKKEGVKEARVEPTPLWLKCAGASPARSLKSKLK